MRKRNLLLLVCFLSLLATACGPRRYGCGPRRCHNLTQPKSYDSLYNTYHKTLTHQSFHINNSLSGAA